MYFRSIKQSEKMINPLLDALFNTNFETLNRFFRKVSEKKPKQAEPYLKALLEIYFYNNTLNLELRELRNTYRTETLAYKKKVLELTKELEELRNDEELNNKL